MSLALLALGLASCPQAPPAQASEGDYRALFDQGVAALAADDTDAAAEFFRSAGEHVPDAPIWRAYLALAEGRTPRSKAKRLRHAPPWRVVTPANGRVQDLHLGPRGERLIVGRDEPDLVDVRTGDLIARLESLIPGGCRRWVFDATGTVVVGRGGMRGTGIDVRDARTGRPLELRGAPELMLTPGATFEWIRTGSQPRGPDCVGTIDLAGPGGVLRCQLVHGTDGWSVLHRSADVVINADGSRAYIVDDDVPARLVVIDRTTGETSLTLEPTSGRVSFSPDGSKLLIRSDRKLRIFDARTCVELPAPTLPADPEPIGRAYTFDGDRLITVGADGTVTAFDTRSGDEESLCTLSPAPPEGVSAIEFISGSDTLVVFGFSETAAYEISSGERRWTSDCERWANRGVFDETRTWIATNDAHGVAIVVDVKTGPPVFWRRRVPLSTTTTLALPGEQAVVVAASDGSLRRVELETGETSAHTTGHAGRSRVILHAAGDGQFLSFSGAGEVRLHDAETLAVRSGARLDPETWLRVSSPDGRHVVGVTGEPGTTTLYALNEAGDGSAIARLDRRVPAAAFSPSSDRVALIEEGRMLILDVETGKVLVDCTTLEGREVSEAAFHGDEFIVVGYSGADFAPAGAVVLRAEDGAEVVDLSGASLFALGGTVMHIQSDTEHGLVVFSISEGGDICAFKDDDWSRAWTFVYGRGNWGTLVIDRVQGEPSIAVSGMTSWHSRILDMATGRVLDDVAVRGISDLAFTPGQRFVVGTRDSSLVVLDGTSRALLYRRTEAAEGSAWILRDGQRVPAPGQPALRDDPTHLIRDGWSAPVDCWDPWLVDPLGLSPIDLNELPAPPRFIDGTDWTVPDGTDTTRLTLRVQCATALLGVRIENEGHAPYFVPITDETPDEAGVTTIEFDLGGGIPVGLRVRAVSRRGIASRPLRISARD